MDISSLSASVNRVVQLEFLDGHVVRARLVAVDVDEPQEIIYDVLEVISRGPDNLANVNAGTVAAADPSLLREVRILE